MKPFEGGLRGIKFATVPVDILQIQLVHAGVPTLVPPKSPLTRSRPRRPHVGAPPRRSAASAQWSVPCDCYKEKSAYEMGEVVGLCRQFDVVFGQFLGMIMVCFSNAAIREQCGPNSSVQDEAAERGLKLVPRHADDFGGSRLSLPQRREVQPPSFC